MYCLLVEMEHELCVMLSRESKLENFKTMVKDRILLNENVCHHWTSVSKNWEVEESEVLLHMITDLWGIFFCNPRIMSCALVHVV